VAGDENADNIAKKVAPTRAKRRTNPMAAPFSTLTGLSSWIGHDSKRMRACVEVGPSLVRGTSERLAGSASSRSSHSG
jgi:hypothetical protein